MEKIIVVLEAGVIGLSTAVNIQTLIPDAPVKITADHFYEDTTSYGSGGMFIPKSESHRGTEIRKLRIPFFREFMFEHESLSDKMMADLGFKEFYRYGFKVTTIVLDQRKYLLMLQQRFEDSDGKTERRKVDNVKEGNVNCCGLMSRDLLEGKSMFSARGQLVRDYITLGGMKQIGNESLSVNIDETETILRHCINLIPSLKVVHNYGHVSDGVALTWGTTLEAAGLVRDVLQRRNEVISKL